jgi:hypothetical protein
MGSENLSKPDIATAIAEFRKAQSERTQATADQVIHQLKLLAFANMADAESRKGEAKPHAPLNTFASTKKDFSTVGVIEVAKAIAQGAPPGEITRKHFYDELKKHSLETCKADETPEQAFSRWLALFKAHRVAPGADCEMTKLTQPTAAWRLGQMEQHAHELRRSQQAGTARPV